MAGNAVEHEVEAQQSTERTALAPVPDWSAAGPITAAGNAAIARLVRAGVRPPLPIAAAGNRATIRTLQRYDAYEHATQGDTAKGSMTVTMPHRSGGMQADVSLTSGEINALADLYASPEDLERADLTELAKLKALIARQQSGGTVQESEWDDATGGRYNRLNLKNSPHFGARNLQLINPGKVGGAPSSQNNREYFVKYYNETVVFAQSAYAPQIGLYDPAVKQKWLDRAVLSAGFAEHFLMDAFSAGHLFSKDDFIAVLAENLRQAGPDGVDLILDQVAHGVLRDAKANALLGTYEITGKNIPWYGGGGYLGHPNLNDDNAVTGCVFKKLLQHMYDDTEGRQAVYSALVKVVHDALSTNKNANGLVGVEVENDFGKWILSGDRTLATSPDTQRMINKALEEFRRQMQPYRDGPVSGGDPTGDAVRLMNAHFPRPTAATVSLINTLVRRDTAGGSDTVNALVAVMLRELPSILKALDDRGEIRKA
jgi:hypothetical protein